MEHSSFHSSDSSNISSFESNICRSSHKSCKIAVISAAACRLSWVVMASKDIRAENPGSIRWISGYKREKWYPSVRVWSLCHAPATYSSRQNKQVGAARQPTFRGDFVFFRAWNYSYLERCFTSFYLHFCNYSFLEGRMALSSLLY